MKHDIEQLLQQALSPDMEPSPWLNQRIIQTAKENEKMKRTKMRIPTGIVAAIFALVLAPLGVLAGWKYLAPKTVAEVFQDASLAKAFESEDAILINETQEYGGYKITLLGIVSGKGLSEYTYWDDEGNIVDDMTYIVTAIENADGTPRPDVSDENFGEDCFYVSPYVKGLAMHEYNIHTFGGGYSEDVIDGVQYRIMECGNVEIFAKRGLYLGVNAGISCNSEAFFMDSATGEITRNPDYKGLNALFELPIPAFKGDEAAVEAYLKEREAAGMEAQNIENAEETEVPEEELDAAARAARETSGWTLTDFETKATCVYEEELVIDENGAVSYEYELEDGSGSEATQWMTYLFDKKETGTFTVAVIYGDEDACVETFEILENGNVLLRVFEIQ